RGNCRNRKTYRYRSGYPCPSSRAYQGRGANEIPFILWSKSIAALPRGSQTMWGYGGRTGDKPQIGQAGRSIARYRQSTQYGGRNRDATCNSGNAMGRKIWGETRCVQCHWCPPRRNRNEIVNSSYSTGLRCHKWGQTWGQTTSF